MKRLVVPIGAFLMVFAAQSAHAQGTQPQTTQPQTTAPQGTPTTPPDQAQCQQLREQMVQDLAQARKDRQANNTVAAKQDLDKVRQDRQKFREQCGQGLRGRAPRLN